MNIDFHVHVTPPEISANWEKYAQKEPYFSLLSHNKLNKFVSADDVVSSLEKEDSIFDRAVIFGFAFRDMGLCRYVNDYVIEKVRQYPHRLTGFCVIPPCAQAAGEIERCRNNGLAGVGELFPEGQGIDLENAKETGSFTDVCRELGLPVLLHTNEPVGHFYSGKTNITLKQTETFINNNQGLDIVLAHWGGGLLFYETMSELKQKFANVYYDTSASPLLYDERIYSAAKALCLCKKILFGSDFPLLNPSRYFDGLSKSALSDEEKRQILGENARKLLRI